MSFGFMTALNEWTNLLLLIWAMIFLFSILKHNRGKVKNVRTRLTIILLYVSIILYSLSFILLRYGY